MKRIVVVSIDVVQWKRRPEFVINSFLRVKFSFPIVLKKIKEKIYSSFNCLNNSSIMHFPVISRLWYLLPVVLKKVAKEYYTALSTVASARFAPISRLRKAVSPVKLRCKLLIDVKLSNTFWCGWIVMTKGKQSDDRRSFHIKSTLSFTILSFRKSYSL